ncbi:hypothetical protein KFE25_007195 [Diacronema lutheri]|uniref:Uncharacterized protein n=1 Tax=Diacronema lutheri TaxID=2081491 RepID=A0A8J6CHV3_DIALT|nr:hypothetical protein KFE25_007195 [Diacronema lutheri]
MRDGDRSTGMASDMLAPCLSERAYLLPSLAARAPLEDEWIATIGDLLPDRSHMLRYRQAESGGEWPASVALGVCSTRAPLPEQPSGLVRRVGSLLEHAGAEVQWSPPACALATDGCALSGYMLERSLEPREDEGAGPLEGGAVVLHVGAHETSARLDGLLGGRAYSVRVRALLHTPSAAVRPAPSTLAASREATARRQLSGDTSASVSVAAAVGPWSDPLVLRTRDKYLAPLAVLRFSERCTPPCEPDYLAQHDAADALADAALITRFVQRAQQCDEDSLALRWPHTVVVRYCAQRSTSAQWGGYLPCNGPSAANYTCNCAGTYDRLLAREPTRGCDVPNAAPPSRRAVALSLSPPPPPGCARHAHARCTCSLRDEEQRIGRMPAYWPSPQSGGAGEPPPPADESVLLGHWFSLPARAQCADGQLPSESGCAWRMAAGQPATIVRGTELLAAGWREAPWQPGANSSTTQLPLSLVLHNAAVLERLLDERSPRCCGC